MTSLTDSEQSALDAYVAELVAAAPPIPPDTAVRLRPFFADAVEQVASRQDAA